MKHSDVAEAVGGLSLDDDEGDEGDKVCRCIHLLM